MKPSNPSKSDAEKCSPTKTNGFHNPVWILDISHSLNNYLVNLPWIINYTMMNYNYYYLIITIVYDYHDYSMISMNPQGSTISTLNSSGSGLRLPRQAPARRCRGGRPCRAPRAPSGSNGRARRHPRGGVREFQWISVGLLWDLFGNVIGILAMVTCWFLVGDVS